MPWPSPPHEALRRATKALLDEPHARNDDEDLHPSLLDADERALALALVKMEEWKKEQSR